MGMQDGVALHLRLAEGLHLLMERADHGELQAVEPNHLIHAPLPRAPYMRSASMVGQQRDLLPLRDVAGIEKAARC